MDDHDEVRELLAALGRDRDAGEPLPDDVARRLDDVLAGLVAERETAASETSASETSASAARTASGADVVRLPRRRGWLAAAGIAAATVLATVALPQLTGNTGDTGVTAADRATTSEAPPEVELSGPLLTADEATRSGAAAQSDDRDQRRVESGKQSRPTAPYAGIPSQRPADDVPRLTRDRLADDVVALLGDLDDRSPLPAADHPPTDSDMNADDQLMSTSAADAGACAWSGRGTAYAVNLDDRRALAVVTDRADSARVVRLLVCHPSGESVEVATAVVPPALLPTD